MDCAAETTQWRAASPRATRAWMLLVGGYFVALTFASWWRDGSGLRVWDLVGVGWHLLMGGFLVGLLALQLRNGVRLLPEGVEVREEGTAVHPYGEIVDVRRNRFDGGRSVTLELSRGRIVLLPVPLARRPRDQAVVNAAVESIRRRVRQHAASLEEPQ